MLRSRVIPFIRMMLRRDDLTAKWVLLGIMVLFIALMFPQGLSVESEYPVGMIWTENDLYAPFAFPIYKEEREYSREREEASKKVFKVFEENTDIAAQQIDSLQHFFDDLQRIIDKQKGTSRQGAPVIPVQFRASEWKTLWFLREADRSGVGKRGYSLNRLRRDVLLVVNGLYLQGIVDIRVSQYAPDEPVARRRKSVEQIVPLDRMVDKYELGKTVQQTFEAGLRTDNDTVAIAVKIALTFLQPNVIFQKEQTERELRYAVDRVPRTTGAVSEGERIIAKQERVTDATKRKLDSLRRAKMERGAGLNVWITFGGKLLRVFAMLWLFVMYIYLFRKRIYHDNVKLLLLSVVFLFVSIVAYSTVQNTSDLPYRYLIIVPAASMILAIVFDSRIAFYSTVVLAMLTAAIRGNDYSLAFASLVAGAFAIYTVRDIKKRTQIFRSIIYIFLGYAAVIVAFGLERYESLDMVGNQLLFASLNALLSPVLAYGALILLERTFGIATELTLVDLSDLNHPLMKELAKNAPGSFHHSVSVATLAESAADAVGANPTLARVGGMYHDIGKMLHPESFVENQIGTENRHRTLSPRKSVRVIAAHIDDGVQLAQRHKLPPSVIDFIRMHHGTMHVGFFYEKALRQKRTKGEVNESDFRYPGPKPNTKETAIVMLADGIEASTRAITEPTVEKIEANIDSLIKLRLLEGELDESDLHLRDLSRIKESFLKILIGFHHSRLRYPEPGTNGLTEADGSTEKRLQRTIDNIDLK